MHIFIYQSIHKSIYSSINYSINSPIHALQVSKVGWAKTLELSTAKEEAVAKFLWWTITSVVNVILRSYFYITELDHQPRTKVSPRKKKMMLLEGGGGWLGVEENRDDRTDEQMTPSESAG